MDVPIVRQPLSGTFKTDEDKNKDISLLLPWQSFLLSLFKYSDYIANAKACNNENWRRGYK